MKSTGIGVNTLSDLEVSCYSGHTYAERPQSFVWQDAKYEVEEIERAWLEPGQRCFEVCTGDNKLIRLCYNEMTKQWSLAEVVRSQ
jgi:hypothetical protein